MGFRDGDVDNLQTYSEKEPQGCFGGTILKTTDTEDILKKHQKHILKKRILKKNTFQYSEKAYPKMTKIFRKSVL